MNEKEALKILQEHSQTIRSAIFDDLNIQYWDRFNSIYTILNLYVEEKSIPLSENWDLIDVFDTLPEKASVTCKKLWEEAKLLLLEKETIWSALVYDREPECLHCGIKVHEKQIQLKMECFNCGQLLVQE